MREANFAMLAAGAAITLLGVILRAERLRTLMNLRERPLKPFFMGIQASDLIEISVPVNVGILLRPLFLMRHLKQRFSQVFAATMVDRIVEVSGIFLIVMTPVFLWPMNGDLILPPETMGTPEPIVVGRTLLRGGVGMIGIVVTGACLFLLMLYFSGQRIAAIVGKVAGFLSPLAGQRMHEGIGHFSERLHVFVSVGQFLRVFALNLGFWGCFVIGSWIIFSAFGFYVAWITPFLMFSILMILRLGPNVPGMLGQYHVAVVLALLAFDPTIPDPMLKAIAVVAHIVHMGIIVVTGLYSIVSDIRTGALTDLRRAFWRASTSYSVERR